MKIQLSSHAPILAIDLGKFNSMCCFFDPQSQQARFQTVPTDRGYLRSFLAAQNVGLVVFEACGPSGWLHDLCQELGLQTLVCSTNEEAWQWKNVKRKTDRDDALKLAQMANLKSLKPVHIPSPRMREYRTLVKHRKSLDQRINRLKNSIRSLFVNHGIQIDHGKRAWCSGRQRIDSFRKPIDQCEAEEFWKAQLDHDLSQLDFITRQLEAVDAKLEELAKENSHVQRLMTIPGVGRKTAEVLVAAIDDPHRFRNAREVSSYIGLVPKQYQSGKTDRKGRITKRGSRLLRTMLVECAWVSLRYNAWAKAVYERIHGGQKSRRKKAGIALARKLAVVAWAMMRDETTWDIARLMPECELEQGAIKVTQGPNLPAGPVRHLPRPLREEPTASPETAPSAEPADGRSITNKKTRRRPKPNPKPRTTPSKRVVSSKKRTTRPRDSGSVTEDARRRGEPHLDVTNRARGQQTVETCPAEGTARVPEKQDLVDSGSRSKGSPRRNTLT
jgi:transposase